MELVAKNLSCERGGREIFSQQNFQLKSGELLLLTGPNGAGKSTLLRLIAGLNQASFGSIELKGGDSELTLGQHCHYLAHNEGIKAALTVSENLSFWCAFNQGTDVYAAMADLNLNPLANFPAGLLSAGQKRRLALARLAVGPRPIWLMDEPSVGLDHHSQTLLTCLMEKHLNRGGLIIATTHVDLSLKANHILELPRRFTA